MLSDKEIIELAYRLVRMEGNDDEENEWAQQLENAAPGMMNLLFWDGRSLSPEEALAKLRKRGPILLGSGS